MREGNKLITKSKGIKKSTRMGIMKNKINANGRPVTWSPRGDNRFNLIQQLMYRLKEGGSTFTQHTKDTLVITFTEM